MAALSIRLAATQHLRFTPPTSPLCQALQSQRATEFSVLRTTSELLRNRGTVAWKQGTQLEQDGCRQRRRKSIVRSSLAPAKEETAAETSVAPFSVLITGSTKGGSSSGGLTNSKTVKARSFWGGRFGIQSAREGGLGLGSRGVEFVSLVTGGDGGGVGGGRDRFGGGGGGGDDDGSDGESGGHIPRQSSGILAWYMDLTTRFPVRTKALTAAILNLLGDLFCQLVIDKKDKLDVKRTALITFLGFILVGPTLHTWYLALSKVVSAEGVTGAGIRLVLDQFLFSPAFIALFFSSLLTLEGRPADIGPKLRQDWKPTVIANWKLWIPFQFVNFLFVPQQLQVAFANVVALAWNVYLSFASHTEVAKAPQISIHTQSGSLDIEMSSIEDGEDRND